MAHKIRGLAATLTALHVTANMAQANAASPLDDNDRDAIFQAAGFKPMGDQYIHCEEDPPTASYRAGSIEMTDLNHDGRPEAWVTEGSLFCYGNTAEFFVLLTQRADGKWIKLIEEAGIAVQQTTRHHGWPDIEVGGPGNGPFPVYRFDGRQYIRGR